MNRSKFNFAAVFSLMVLLGYSYLMFMGLVYWREGSIAVPLLITIGFIALVVACLVIMCMSRATRWKRIGSIGQAIFGTIILLAFIASAIPFTNFMDVVASQNRFSEEINHVLDAAKGLDENYQGYVRQRLDNYRNMLGEVSERRASAPSDYDRLLGGAAGNNDQQKIENMVNMLRRKLVPDSSSMVAEERQQWLEGAADMSVWNLLLPTNMAKINQEVSNWTEMYTDFSRVTVGGEQTAPFEYEEFSSELQALTSRFTRLHAPSILAIIIALLCFGIMLLPYLLTERDVAGRTSKGKVIYE